MTMTTPDGATTVKLFLEAVLAGDVETALSYVDDDVEMNTAEHHPFLPGQYRGRQGFLEIIAKIGEVLDGFRFDVQRVLACGDVAVSQQRYYGTVKHNGRSLDVQAAFIWDVRDGKVIRNQEYLDTLQFMNAWQASES
jgi:uncharacterized protein